VPSSTQKTSIILSLLNFCASKVNLVETVSQRVRFLYPNGQSEQHPEAIACDSIRSYQDDLYRPSVWIGWKQNELQDLYLRFTSYLYSVGIKWVLINLRLERGQLTKQIGECWISDKCWQLTNEQTARLWNGKSLGGRCWIHGPRKFRIRTL
jgi:hypothetical protein